MPSVAKGGSGGFFDRLATVAALTDVGMRRTTNQDSHALLARRFAGTACRSAATC